MTEPSPGPHALSSLGFAVTFAVSLLALFLPEVPGGGVEVPGLDKAVHAVLFAALSAASAWRFGRRRAVLGGLTSYAVSSELIQAVAVPSRGGDPFDVVADLAGVVIFWVLADAWSRSRSGSVQATSAHDEVAR